MYAFEIVRPNSVAEAVAALQAEGAQALGGGQTLIPTLKQRLASPETLVGLSGLAEISGVSVEGGAIVAGGAATHHAVAEATASACPAIAHLAGHIGDPAVRHKGTIGGSLANNDPAACWPAGALGAGATISVQGAGGSRDIAADDFFDGMFATTLGEGEIITKVTIPIPEAAGYEKFLQPASRFAMVGVFAAKTASGPRVAVTGASEGGVFRWAEAEAALASNWSPDALAGLSVDADDMIEDIHASKPYRAHLVRVIAQRAVAKA